MHHCVLQFYVVGFISKHQVTDTLVVLLSDIRRKPACATFKTATDRRFIMIKKCARATLTYSAAIAHRLLYIEVGIPSTISRNGTISHFCSPVHVTG